ncbi:membrane-spanning 4-domains subfamily A member 18 [Grammomys surdaster]|uniref:membrane-spanning 4-domains subfamily A member 18 n=1 Tax=Grammomys surdaster TaxID=491861 RepID=UPI00109FC65E|nr:membrane-spanning 4-domains subfamily A member 18 [Grammomys surdaster]
MSNQENVSAVTVPSNVRVIQPTYAVVSGRQEQPLAKTTTYPASATVLQYNSENANFQNPHIVIQNPAAMTGLQARSTGLQYPAGMAGVQTPPGVIQYSPETTSVQILPGDPQSLLNTVPGPTQTSSHPQWNMSFMSFHEFNPKKFINEEVRTLGAIQILIGLFHIFSAVNPQLYRSSLLLGLSGYLIWGGLSVNSSIGMNVVSSILSLTGIIIIIIDLCVYNSSNNFLMSSMKAISGSLLPFALLEFILTCVVSHFGCQAVCWTHFENMTIPTMFGGNTVNTTTGPVDTTSPNSATNIPGQAALPSEVPPEQLYQEVDHAQK